MKISIIVEQNIEKSTKESLEDVVKMIVELSERYQYVINMEDVQITFTV